MGFFMHQTTAKSIVTLVDSDNWIRMKQLINVSIRRLWAQVGGAADATSVLHNLHCTVALVATFNARTSVRIWNPTCGPRPAPRPIWGLFTSSQRAHAAGLPTIFFAPFKFQVANCEIGACLFGRRRVMIAWKKVPLEGFVYGWWQGRRVEGTAWPWLLSLDSWKWWIMDDVSGRSAGPERAWGNTEVWAALTFSGQFSSPGQTW